MKIYKAYKFRLYPDINQQQLINSFLGTSRFIYNHYLNLKDETYKNNGINLSLNDYEERPT